MKKIIKNVTLTALCGTMLLHGMEQEPPLCGFWGRRPCLLKRHMQQKHAASPLAQKPAEKDLIMRDKH